MSSAGCSATSGSRLFRSIRSGASADQERAFSSLPRGARMRVRSPHKASTFASSVAVALMDQLPFVRAPRAGGGVSCELSDFRLDGCDKITVANGRGDGVDVAGERAVVLEPRGQA